ncbi:MAG: hypothetical protein ACKPKO_36930 [Candidatus Fonsibacter sp.]
MIILWIMSKPINITIIWITTSAVISKLPFLSSDSGTYFCIVLFKIITGIMAIIEY